ncbi:hypothetical protein V8J88_13405 [Massilia sp. W12]|uniref:hypothetical protein n=1 Tax=Massilia sp. W12 TaxID=3126507 RepID=UPI0030CACC0D
MLLASFGALGLGAWLVMGIIFGAAGFANGRNLNKWQGGLLDLALWAGLLSVPLGQILAWWSWKQDQAHAWYWFGLPLAALAYFLLAMALLYRQK